MEPGDGYTGVNYFFPENQDEIIENYTLNLIPDNEDYGNDLKDAIYRFMQEMPIKTFL